MSDLDMAEIIARALELMKSAVELSGSQLAVASALTNGVSREATAADAASQAQAALAMTTAASVAMDLMQKSLACAVKAQQVTPTKS